MNIAREAQPRKQGEGSILKAETGRMVMFSPVSKCIPFLSIIMLSECSWNIEEEWKDRNYLNGWKKVPGQQGCSDTSVVLIELAIQGHGSSLMGANMIYYLQMKNLNRGFAHPRRSVLGPIIAVNHSDRHKIIQGNTRQGKIARRQIFKHYYIYIWASGVSADWETITQLSRRLAGKCNTPSPSCISNCVSSFFHIDVECGKWGEMVVGLTSTLQRASSVYAVLQGTAGHPSRDLFFIPLSFRIASIRFISSLQCVNTVSVCLTSSPRPNDYYTAFFVFILRNAILIQQWCVGEGSIQQVND